MSISCRNDGIFFSNKLYKYTSPGIILPGEAENVFETYRETATLRVGAGMIDVQGMAKELAAFQANRIRPATVEWPDSRGTVYFEQFPEGRRRFDLVHTQQLQAPGNRILHYLGALVLFCGFVGLFIEWRLRRLKKQTSSR